MQHREQLGEGKAGFIWTTDAEFFGKSAVVKTLHHPDASVNNLQKEFRLQERFLHAGVQVPRPIGVVGGKAKSEAFIGLFAMERIHGVNLQEWVRLRATNGETIDKVEYAALRAKIKALIGQAHDAGLYHRDLHLRNLMIDGTGKILMVDFGDAKEALGGESDAEIYRSEAFRNGKMVVVTFPRDEDVLRQLSEEIYEQKLLAA